MGKRIVAMVAVMNGLRVQPMERVIPMRLLPILARDRTGIKPNIKLPPVLYVGDETLRPIRRISKQMLLHESESYKSLSIKGLAGRSLAHELLLVDGTNYVVHAFAKGAAKLDARDVVVAGEGKEREKISGVAYSSESDTMFLATFHDEDMSISLNLHTFARIA